MNLKFRNVLYNIRKQLKNINLDFIKETNVRKEQNKIKILPNRYIHYNEYYKRFKLLKINELFYQQIMLDNYALRKKTDIHESKHIRNVTLKFKGKKHYETFNTIKNIK